MAREALPQTLGFAATSVKRRNPTELWLVMLVFRKSDRAAELRQDDRVQAAGRLGAFPTVSPPPFEIHVLRLPLEPGPDISPGLCGAPGMGIDLEVEVESLVTVNEANRRASLRGWRERREGSCRPTNRYHATY